MANQDNPFLNFDFARIFSESGFPGADLDAMLASQKKNIEALVSAGQVVAEGYQAVAQRQSEIVRTAMGEAQAKVDAAKMPGTMNEQLAGQTELLKSGIEQVIRNLRESSELVQKSRTEALEILGRRVAEGLDELKKQSGS